MSKGQNEWVASGGQDFLRLLNERGQGVLGGIDITGKPYGSLAQSGSSSSVFSVLDYGAVPDGVIDGLSSLVDWIASASGTGITATVTLSNNFLTFAQKDVGKIFTANNPEVPAASVYGTIVNVIGPNQIQVQGNFGTSSIFLSGGYVGWGTDNTEAFINCSAAVQANVQSGVGGQYLGPIPGPTTMYVPSGVYFVTASSTPVISLLQDSQGITLQGDGSSESVIAVGTITTGDPLVVSIQGKLRGISIEGMGVTSPSGGTAVSHGGGILEDVKIEHWAGLQAITIFGACTVNNLTVIKNWFHGIAVLSGNINFFGCILSNNGGQGINFQNSTGQCSWYGGVIDESGGNYAGGAPANFVVENNGGNIVTVRDTTIYAFGTDIIVNTGTLIASGCVITPYSSTGGIEIASGATFVARDCLIDAFASPGVSNFTVNNSGTFRDEGGNTVEFECGTSNISQSGNTVTVTTNGANLNLSAQNIGQKMYIYGYTGGPAVYNGTWIISGVPSSTSVQFQMQTTGNPTSTQTGHVGVISKYGAGYIGNPPVIGGTQPTINFSLAALTANTQIGVWTPTEDIRIVRIQISSSQVTSSSAAPVLTLSNGNVSVTVTLTSGQQSWDSGILTSTYFSQNLPITISITQGTNATAPANMNITIAYDGYGY